MDSLLKDMSCDGMQGRGTVERLLTKEEWSQTEAEEGQKAGTIALVGPFFEPFNPSHFLRIGRSSNSMF